MDDQDVLDTLRNYLSTQILQDSSVTIDSDTPLLEWGILNSISIVQLISFIRERFGIEIPEEEVVGGKFQDLRSITRLLAQLDGRSQPIIELRPAAPLIP